MRFARLLLFPLVLRASVAVADDSLRDLCPDRPGKNNSACTVDANHFQLESALFDGTFQHLHGITTDTYFVADPTLKYGVTGNFDVEASLAPLEILRRHDTRTGEMRTYESVGDLFLRAKWAAIGNGGSDFALVLEPFLKIPTAQRPIGNGSVEGGLLMPIAATLGDGWSLQTTPEMDVNLNASGRGYHPALTGVIGLSRTVGEGVTLEAEFWESTDFDPAGSAQQFTADLDASWIPGSLPGLQLDGGVNFGLDRNAPGVEIYCGLS